MTEEIDFSNLEPEGFRNELEKLRDSVPSDANGNPPGGGSDAWGGPWEELARIELESDGQPPEFDNIPSGLLAIRVRWYNLKADGDWLELRINDDDDTNYNYRLARLEYWRDDWFSEREESTDRAKVARLESDTQSYGYFVAYLTGVGNWREGITFHSSWVAGRTNRARNGVGAFGWREGDGYLSPLSKLTLMSDDDIRSGAVFILEGVYE